MDPKALTLSRNTKPVIREKAPRHKSGDHFLRGPIPMNWLYAASAAAGRGSGFQVAIAIWYLSGLNKQARTVKLRGSVLRRIGVDRHAVYRGLEVLEHARLVSVERRPGQSPVVTILDLQEAN